MTAALDWYFRAGADSKKLDWLRKLQEEGHEVRLLEDEPQITLYEEKIITASFICESMSDIYYYSKIHKVKDRVEFTDLVLLCRSKVKENSDSKQ